MDFLLSFEGVGFVGRGAREKMAALEKGGDEGQRRGEAVAPRAGRWINGADVELGRLGFVRGSSGDVKEL
jgi:hypothetical protein